MVIVREVREHSSGGSSHLTFRSRQLRHAVVTRSDLVLDGDCVAMSGSIDEEIVL